MQSSSGRRRQMGVTAGKAFESIKRGLQEAIAHRKGNARGVKTFQPAQIDVQPLRQRIARKTPASVPGRPHLLEWLKDPRNAAAYVEAVLDEGDPARLMQALRNATEANGGVAALAERAGLSRETLYRTLSKRGNPQLGSLTAILDASGLRLSVKPVEKQAA